MISFPSRNASGLLDPFAHFRPFYLLQGLYLHIARGLFKGRRKIELLTAKEYDVHGDIAGDHLNLNRLPGLGQSIIRFLPFDGVLKSGESLTDQFI